MEKISRIQNGSSLLTKMAVMKTYFQEHCTTILFCKQCKRVSIIKDIRGQTLLQLYSFLYVKARYSGELSGSSWPLV